MSVILVFIAFVVLGEGIATVIEHFSKSASLLAFLGMLVLVFWIAWMLAVRVTERFILRQP